MNQYDLKKYVRFKNIGYFVGVFLFVCLNSSIQVPKILGLLQK